MSVSQSPEFSDEFKRWTATEVFQLIDIVKECEAIYNPMDKNYFCRGFVENLWREIDIRMGKRPGACLSKWTNLRISFRREYQLLVKKKVRPSWVYFQNMLFLQPFLRKKRQPGGANIDSHIQEALQQINSITRSNCKNFVSKIDSYDTDQSETPETARTSAGWSRRGNSDSLIKTDENSVHDDTECYDAGTVSFEGSLDDIEDDFSNGSDVQAIDDNPEVNYETTEASSSPRAQKRKLDIQTVDLTRKFVTPKRQYSATAGESSSAHQSPASSQFSNTSPLCECKTNPDAMFLLSLMPDIQSLSRKDKGKLKIEIQRLIQNYVYPDDE